ncbi:MAG: hypothetical protein O2955_01950 [Planctomycetota bacterium]|nr:hypothetical protein [Planctomycetota bacterium]MDA1211246.1 hypothetical protein [Planctomycetota bacterium]
MIRKSVFLFCLGILSIGSFAFAQTDATPAPPVPQPDPSFQAPPTNTPRQIPRSQTYLNRKAQEAYGTPYGTINGKEYRPQPIDYYTRPRALHPQAVRGWGYDPNAANYGPDYGAGVLPADYPVPQKGSNVTFRLPGENPPSAPVSPSSQYVPHGTPIHGYAGAPGTESCVRQERGVGLPVDVMGGYPAVTTYGGGPSSYYGSNSPSYLANYNYPNASTQALVPAGSDPKNFHFGDGLHRSGVSGHYRFPYYSYRRPWYYPGEASFQRNTQFPW